APAWGWGTNLEFHFGSWTAPAFSRRQALSAVLPLGVALLAACSGAGGAAKGAASDGGLVAWPSQDRWPDLFVRAKPEVQEAYRFALANPDVLRYIPCFCGCVNAGHTSNKDCYIKEQRQDGSVLLEPMSFT